MLSHFKLVQPHIQKIKIYIFGTYRFIILIFHIGTYIKSASYVYLNDHVKLDAANNDNTVRFIPGMPMMMAPTDAPPAPQYGPPASQYGPAASTSAPQDSYAPQWEPSSNGPYARVWDPSQLAYNSYYPGDSSSSTNSDQSPSYSNVASVSSSSSAN